MTDQILISVITAFATAILTYFGFWRQMKAELYKEHKIRFNEKKWEVYTSFIELLPILYEINHIVELRGHGKQNLDDNLKLSALQERYHELEGKVESKILLIGSKKVVGYYLEWESRIEIAYGRDEFVVEILILLLNAMREDLGQEKSDITLNDLNGLYYFSQEKREEMKKHEWKSIEEKMRYPRP